MRKYNLVIVAIIISILICLMLFPLISNFTKYIPGFHSTDESYAALWNFWWLSKTHADKLPIDACPLIAAPFDLGYCKNVYFLWNLINKWLTVFTSNIVAYNTEIVFSFLLAAFFVYLLAYHICRNVFASFLSAVIYAFCPYHFVRSWQHLGLAQIQWMPLFIFALIKLDEKRSIKYAAILGIAFFLVASFDLYYAYFMFLTAPIYILYSIFAKFKLNKSIAATLKEELNFLRMLVLSAFFAGVLYLPSISMILHNAKISSGKGVSVFNTYLRPFEDLFSQSARPLSYFLPASTHPVFGGFTESFVGTGLYGESYTEHALYLGWVPLILAFFAFRRRRISKDPSERYYICCFLVLAVVAWLFSQPPWWQFGPFKLYMPSFFMYKLFPMFRAYCRFGIVVMLAVSILAALGLKVILDRFKGGILRFCVTVICCVLVLFEFWNWPPYKVIDVSGVPSAYYWLHSTPGDFIIAEYPLDYDGSNELYKFYQTKHEKKIINGTIPGTFANKVAHNIIKLSDLNTARVLKWMGVRYVLVHKNEYLKTELTEDKEELSRISGNSGLKLVKDFPAESCPNQDIRCVRETGPIDVYEVIAQPKEPKVEQ